jgi:uncharacterized protein
MNDPASIEQRGVERTVATRVVAFGRALREAGLGVTTGQVMLFLDAVAVVDITDPLAFHDAARASLVSHAEEIDTFEAVFARFWARRQHRGQGQGESTEQASRTDKTPPPIASRRRPRNHPRRSSRKLA